MWSRPKQVHRVISYPNNSCVAIVLVSTSCVVRWYLLSLLCFIPEYIDVSSPPVAWIASGIMKVSKQKEILQISFNLYINMYIKVGTKLIYIKLN